MEKVHELFFQYIVSIKTRRTLIAKMNCAYRITRLLLLSWTISCTFASASFYETKFEKTREQRLAPARQSLKVNPGDVVRLIAPGSAGASELPPMISYIESLGLVPNMTENIYQPFEPFFHSNTDDFRVNDLISALTDDSKVIWCIRGGRGNSRLISLLEQRLPATLKNHKIFIGQSDITVLHLYLQYKYGWQTIHGSNLDYVGIGFYEGSAESQQSLVTLTDLIFGQESICLPLMTKFDERPFATEIESRVVGGNIELVETSLGTFWQIDTLGRIIFLEGVGEAAWRTERSLDHMKLAGIFDHVEAIVFGDFTSVDNYTLVEVVLKRFAQEVSVPVFKLTGIGHGPINYPIPLLASAHITRIDSNTFQLCVDNVNDDIIRGNNSGSNSKIKSSSNLLILILIGISIVFVFQKDK